MQTMEKIFCRFTLCTSRWLMTIMLVLATTVSIVSQTEAQVNFPDPNLEAAIRDALGIQEGPITDSDLAGLTELDASERSVSNLSGIEHCINLHNLNLERNSINDISQLSGLTDLQMLNLAFNNRITELSSLRNLTKLQTLNLAVNQIIYISPLSDLPNMRRLYLYDNQISDISPLSGLTKLQELSLGGNKVIDLNPLSRLINLERLQVESNQVIDLAPLSGLTHLQPLDLT